MAYCDFIFHFSMNILVFLLPLHSILLIKLGVSHFLLHIRKLKCPCVSVVPKCKSVCLAWRITFPLSLERAQQNVLSFIPFDMWRWDIRKLWKWKDREKEIGRDKRRDQSEGDKTRSLHVQLYRCITTLHVLHAVISNLFSFSLFYSGCIFTVSELCLCASVCVGVNLMG